eukprot:COSAG02_NODE_792_length_17157_cov_6.602122_7_plen_93_part_00
MGDRSSSPLDRSTYYSTSVVVSTSSTRRILPPVALVVRVHPVVLKRMRAYPLHARVQLYHIVYMNRNSYVGQKFFPSRQKYILQYFCSGKYW